MNAVIGTGNVDAIAAVWKAFAPILPSPPRGSIKPHRQPVVPAPEVVVESVPILGAVGVEPDAGEPSDAPAPPKLQIWAESVPIHGLDDADSEAAAPKQRGAGGKAKKQKAHNQPPEYKPPTKKALKEAKPPAKLKAFQAYVIVQTAKLGKQGVTFESPGDRMKELAARWKALSDAEKERYKSKALKLDEERHAEWMAKQ